MAKAGFSSSTVIVAFGLAALLMERSVRRANTALLPQPAAPPTGLPPKMSRHPGARDQVDAPREAERAGHDAEGPSQIPLRGWWVVIRRAVAGFSEDRVMAEAAGVTFYALLALFPAIASLISVYGLFADPAAISQQLQGLNGVIPGGGIDIINAEIAALTSSGQKALGLGAAIGLATSLWSANAGVKAFFDALNVVYHEHEKRGFVWLTLISLTFTFGLIGFLVVAMVGVVVVPVVLNYVGFGNETETLVNLARWPLLLVIVAVMLSLLYRFGPSRRRARWQWVSWGSALAATAWIGVSIAFSYYVANFGSYNKTYGSLGAVVGFMTWIWISSMVVLMGAELNAELEQQTLRDSTIGPAKPMGERGAFKADVKRALPGAA